MTTLPEIDFQSSDDDTSFTDSMDYQRAAEIMLESNLNGMMVLCMLVYVEYRSCCYMQSIAHVFGYLQTGGIKIHGGDQFKAVS